VSFKGNRKKVTRWAGSNRLERPWTANRNEEGRKYSVKVEAI